MKPNPSPSRLNRGPAAALSRTFQGVRSPTANQGKPEPARESGARGQRAAHTWPGERCSRIFTRFRAEVCPSTRARPRLWPSPWSSIAPCQLQRSIKENPTIHPSPSDIEVTLQLNRRSPRVSSSGKNRFLQRGSSPRLNQGRIQIISLNLIEVEVWNTIISKLILS